MYNNNGQVPPWVRYMLSLVGVLIFTSAFSDKSRFNFINKKTQTSFKFELIENLIVIPVTVNDMDLNLILDTGMRSIILFGRRFERELEVLEGHTVRLSGYGKRKQQPGKLSLNNNLTIADVLGTQIGIIVMPGNQIFKLNGMKHVDGIIGYEIFSRFTVKIDYKSKYITLYEPFVEPQLEQFDMLPLTIKDTKPYIPALVQTQAGKKHEGHFHLDTGSSQDVMIFLNEHDAPDFDNTETVIVGLGIGGRIEGYKGIKSDLILGEGYAKRLIPKYIRRGFSNRELANAQGSIGSGLLKDSVIILDYIHQKFYFKRQIPPIQPLMVNTAHN